MKKIWFMVFLLFGSIVLLRGESSEVKIEYIRSNYFVLDEYKYPGKYGPINAIDGDLTTCLAEGADDSKIEFEVQFAESITIDQINIANGYAKIKDLFLNNNRMKTVYFYYSDENDKLVLEEKHVLLDQQEYQSIKFKEVKINNILLSCHYVYPGTKFNDTCISEIKFYHKGKEIKIGNIEQLRKEYLNKITKDLTDYLSGHRYELDDKEGFVYCGTDGTLKFSGLYDDNAESEGPSKRILYASPPTHWKVEDHKLYMKVKGKWELVDYWLHYNKELLAIRKIGPYDFGQNFIVIEE